MGRAMHFHRQDVWSYKLVLLDLKNKFQTDNLPTVNPLFPRVPFRPLVFFAGGQKEAKNCNYSQNNVNNATVNKVNVQVNVNKVWNLFFKRE